jgi:hypothetical protein
LRRLAFAQHAWLARSVEDWTNLQRRTYHVDHHNRIARPSFFSIVATMRAIPKPPKEKRKASSSPSKDDSSKATIKKAKASSRDYKDNVGPAPVARAVPQAKSVKKKGAPPAAKAKSAQTSNTDQSAQKSRPKIIRKNRNANKPLAAQFKSKKTEEPDYLQVDVDYKAVFEEESDAETVPKPKVQQKSIKEIAKSKIEASVVKVQQMHVDNFLSTVFETEDKNNAQTLAQYLHIVKKRRDQEEEETMASMGEVRTRLKGVQSCAVWYFDLLNACSSRLGNFNWMAFLIAVWLGK